MQVKSPILTLAFVLVFLFQGCSEVPENNDPVIGIWSRLEVPEGATYKGHIREEWIFNDVYLGRYQRYEGSQIILKSDFQWESAAGFYRIEYPGLDKPADEVKIVRHEEGEHLENRKGVVFAERE